MAKYKKKRARELQHDKFRDAAGKVFDRVADQLEGKGKTIIYVLVGAVLLATLIGFYIKWSHKKADEARRALGRGIAIAGAPLATESPAPITSGPTYSNEQERAQKAIEEFQKVVAKYGDPYKTEARYFIGTNLLSIDRARGMAELADVSQSSVTDVAALAKYALAQANETDGKYDDAARLLSQLAAQNNPVVSTDTANLQLADVYEKQGKRTEAAQLLFNIIDASRKAKDADGTPLPESGAAREAGPKLQKLDPDLYAKLTPELPSGESPF